MSTQLSLEGIEEPRPPTDALFFALVPDAQALGQIGQRVKDFRDKFGLKSEPLATDRFHITLYYLGAYAGVPQSVAAGAREAAESIRVAPFELVFDRAMSFSGKRGNSPFVLCSSEVPNTLTTLQQTLRAAVGMAGLGKWKQPAFLPHVTLLYDGRRVPEQAVEPIRWTVSEFVLVHSLLGQSRHEPLARWPLVA